jgi:hypothetical protein
MTLPLLRRMLASQDNFRFNLPAIFVDFSTHAFRLSCAPDSQCATSGKSGGSATRDSCGGGGWPFCTVSVVTGYVIAGWRDPDPSKASHFWKLKWQRKHPVL